MAPAHHPAQISFIGTGDCGPVHGPADGFPIERYTELVRPTLRAVDLRFTNCERQYSSRGVASETSPHGRQPPEMAQTSPIAGSTVPACQTTACRCAGRPSPGLAGIEAIRLYCLVSFIPLAPVLHQIDRVHAVTRLRERLDKEEGLGDAPLGGLAGQFIVQILRN